MVNQQNPDSVIIMGSLNHFIGGAIAKPRSEQCVLTPVLILVILLVIIDTVKEV